MLRWTKVAAAIPASAAFLSADVGSIVIQQLRGWAARAPYFSNGSGRDLAAFLGIL